MESPCEWSVVGGGGGGACSPQTVSVTLKTFEAMFVMQVSISATQSAEVKAAFSVQDELLVYFGV